jgi:hypothetical protein
LPRIIRKFVQYGLMFCFLSFQANAQEADSTQIDIVDVILGKKRLKTTNERRSDRKVFFSIIPSSSEAAGGERTIITTINAAFVLGDPAVTDVSNIFLIPYTDFVRRYGIMIRPNIWLNGNSWNFAGDYRVMRFPQYTWGVGGNTPEDAQTLIEENYIRFYQTALIRILPYTYVGPGYALDYHYGITETEVTTREHLEDYPVDTPDPSVSSGITLNFSYDRRHNALNPPRGAFFLISWRLNFDALGSDQDNQTLFIDGRKYFDFSDTRANILAFRSYYWTTLTGDVPYLDLPSTNRAPVSGIASRGFRQARYRSNAMMYFEAEQRLQLTANGLFGMVVFAHLASASEFGTQHFKYWQPGAGFGLRTKFNKYANSNIAIDLGFSSNFWGVWLNIGEVF